MGRLFVGFVRRAGWRRGAKAGACHLKAAGALSQNDRGRTNRLLVVRTRWKGLFLDSFKVVSLQAVQSLPTSPVTDARFFSTLEKEHIVLGEHLHASTTAWDKRGYQNFSRLSNFLFSRAVSEDVALRSTQATDHIHIPQLHFKEPLVSFICFKALWAFDRAFGTESSS